MIEYRKTGGLSINGIPVNGYYCCNICGAQYLVEREAKKHSCIDNVCLFCEYDPKDCPARETAGDFAYALVCKCRKNKLKLIE